MTDRQDRQAAEAEERAAHHRRIAGELYARHRSEDSEAALADAKRESAKAAEWEQRAERLRQGIADPEAEGKAHPAFEGRGEAEEAATSGWDRRSWYLPGSVASDKLLQFSEAKDSGLLAELGTYAARSVADKDHRTFEGARLVGKAVTAPVRAGRAVLEEARRHRADRERAPDGGVLAELRGAEKERTRASPARETDMREKSPEKTQEREPER